MYLRLPLLRSHAASSSYFLYAARISIHLPSKTIEVAAIPPIHTLAEPAVIRVAVVVGIVGGVGVACGLLVDAIHSLNLPFYGLIITHHLLQFNPYFCYNSITIAGRLVGLVVIN